MAKRRRWIEHSFSSRTRLHHPIAVLRVTALDLAVRHLGVPPEAYLIVRVASGVLVDVVQALRLELLHRLEGVHFHHVLFLEQLYQLGLLSGCRVELDDLGTKRSFLLLEGSIHIDAARLIDSLQPVLYLSFGPVVGNMLADLDQHPEHLVLGDAVHDEGSPR